MTGSSKKLIIVDLSNFIFRAFFAIRPLHAPDGTPVNAVYGVANMLLKMLEEHKPTHFLIAQDTKEPSFRHKLYDDYKGNRTEAPDELVPQFPLIEKMLDVMEIPRLSMVGYEADDIIGSMTVQLQNDFDQVLIASGDKDLMQFVNEKVKILDTMKDKILGRDEVYEKMGVYPEQIVDYLAMVGDSSDNIPGVPGIGAKGAANLLAKYQNLETIIGNQESIANKRAQTAISQNEDLARLSKELITIKTDLSLDITKLLNSYLFQPGPSWIELLQELGFKSLINKWKNQIDVGKNQASSDQDFQFFEKSYVPTSFFKIDLANTTSDLSKVTTLLSDCKQDLVAIIDEGQWCRLQCGKQQVQVIFPTEDQFIPVRNKFWQLIQSHQGWIATWEGKSLAKSLEFSEVKIFDIVQVDYILNAHLPHSLDMIIQRFFLDEDQSMSQPDLLAMDQTHQCVLLFEIAKRQLQQLKDDQMLKVYEDLDGPLIGILSEMETIGVQLDQNYFLELEKKFQAELDDIKTCIYEQAGEDINLNSPKQVAKLLFEQLELPVIKKTKTGYSTDASVLEKLTHVTDHIVPKKLLEFREVDKILSTYVRSLPKLVDQKTSRLHTRFHQNTTLTGRLSSDQPNLQNIPIRSPKGKLLRKGFVAKENHTLFTADYSQIELRLLAHFSEDPTMVKSFAEGLDIHAQTAAEIFKVKLKDVTSDQRASAKAINFGLMYGQSSYGLSETLGISQAEAKKYIRFYFQRFSHVKGYLDFLVERCESFGYTETLFGRRRVIPEIHAQNRVVKSQGQRMAINTPIQGTAADLLKLAMIEINRKIKQQDFQSHMILQVHDELIFEVASGELESIQKIVIDAMEGAYQLKVPLVVDCSIGQNWLDLK